MEIFCYCCGLFFKSEEKFCPKCKGSDIEVTPPESNQDSYAPGSAKYNDLMFGDYDD